MRCLDTGKDHKLTINVTDSEVTFLNEKGEKIATVSVATVLNDYDEATNSFYLRFDADDDFRDWGKTNSNIAIVES